jgi:hypothetical protein
MAKRALLVHFLAGLLPVVAGATSLAHAEPKAGISFRPAVKVASGPAHRGPWKMNESDYRWVDDPAVAMTRDGEVLVAYADQSRKNVFLQRHRRDGTLVSAPTNVSRSDATFSWLPRLVVDSDGGEVLALWQEIVFSGGSHGGEIFFARSTDGGRTFTAPTNLSNDPAGSGKGRLSAESWDNGSLAIARAPNGTIHVAWSDYEGRLWLRRSDDAGESFSRRIHLGGDEAQPARAPSIAADVRGRVHVAWSVGESATADVRVASSNDGRSFETRVLSSPGAQADAPRLAVDGRSVLHLVHAEKPIDGGSWRIVYRRLPNATGGFEAPRLLPVRSGEDARFPQIGADDQGGVVVSWERFGAGAARPNGLGLVVSRDRGDSFAAAGVPNVAGPSLGQSGSQQGMLTQKLAVNETGGVAVANSTFRPNASSAVWLAIGRIAR